MYKYWLEIELGISPNSQIEELKRSPAACQAIGFALLQRLDAEATYQIQLKWVETKCVEGVRSSLEILIQDPLS